MIGGWVMIASWTVIPTLFVLAPVKRNALRNWPLRLILATVISWYATFVFRMQFDLPATREFARERGDHTYDGVGIGIGGRIAPAPLPHHRTCGSATMPSADFQSAPSNFRMRGPGFRASPTPRYANWISPDKNVLCLRPSS